MVKTFHIAVAIAAVLVVIYIIGATLGSTFFTGCASIQELRQCWKLSPDYVDSDLCTAARPCLAQPEDQQHNALVALLIDACEKSKQDDYSDQQLVSRIEEVFSSYTGYSIDVQQLCEQPGSVLVFRNYE